MPGVEIRPWRRAAGKAAFWYAVLACYLAVLLFLSLNPSIRPATTSGFLSPDKIAHAIAYGGLAILTFICLTKSREDFGRRTGRTWGVAVAMAASVGGLIEVAQALFTRNRTGSLDDALANALGAVIGCVVYLAAKRLLARVAMSDSGSAT
ncbi:MAG TPA: VanZ family protein [Rhodocyclaceae bacterium]|nr:VanZ family protein [Rhodocyclaceae bacterium]